MAPCLKGLQLDGHGRVLAQGPAQEEAHHAVVAKARRVRNRRRLSGAGAAYEGVSSGVAQRLVATPDWYLAGRVRGNVVQQDAPELWRRGQEADEDAQQLPCADQRQAGTPESPPCGV